MIRWKAACFVLAVLLVCLGGCVLPPVEIAAQFAVSPSSGVSPLVVTFDASASHITEGVISSYAWDFGDGTTGQGMITAHRYAVEEERTYTVTLRITDQHGNQAAAHQSINVSPSPVASQAPRIEFVWPFHYDASGDDAANLNDEYFALQNKGDQTVDLSGWTVSNERGVTYQIPSGTSLLPNAVLYIHSGDGSNSDTILYWNAIAPVWNNDGDIAFLSNREGLIVAIYPYYPC